MKEILYNHLFETVKKVLVRRILNNSYKVSYLLKICKTILQSRQITGVD